MMEWLGLAMRTLRQLRITGFKSIADAELTFTDLDILIGANGSGKSNLIGVFRLLERVLSRNLQLYVAGEPDRFLHHGRKTTPALSLDFAFDKNAYGFKLKAVQDTLIFEYERVEYSGYWTYGEPIAVGHKESQLEEAAGAYKNQIPKFVFPRVRNLVVYHFHDTSDSSPAKQMADLEDNRFLRPDAANLPAYLYWLQEKHPRHFQQIEEYIRLVAPFLKASHWHPRGSTRRRSSWSGVKKARRRTSTPMPSRTVRSVSSVWRRYCFSLRRQR